MNTARLFPLCLAFALPISVAMAQNKELPATSTPTVGASMSSDCAKPMTRHNHAVERGAPPALEAEPCAPMPATKRKGKNAHDHAKFNKNE